MANEYKYQKDLSKASPILLDNTYKKPKVDKMLSILEDVGALSGSAKLAIDIGCSAGFFTQSLTTHFNHVVGIDIDEGALALAQRTSAADNITFLVGDSMKLPFPDESVDLVICNHVYEHVPDAKQLFNEIERVLSPTGVCYLGAASRLTIIEPHYKLPFLSWLPKPIANRYMIVTGQGSEYYENLRTRWGIQQLVSRFFIKDYTIPVLLNPEKFCARDMIKQGSWIEKIPEFVLHFFYSFLPSYILILRKSITHGKS